jgi:hypothetical protein
MVDFRVGQTVRDIRDGKKYIVTGEKILNGEIYTECTQTFTGMTLRTRIKKEFLVLAEEIINV